MDSGPAPLQRLRVGNTGGSGANLRREPNAQSERVELVPDGALVDLVDPGREVGGAMWREVRTDSGATGWISAEFLSPVTAVLYTTPIPWLLLAALGLWPALRGALRREPVPLLALTWIAVTLGRMYLPGAVNFDGVRHFLELFPALALLAAIGGGTALQLLDRWRSRYAPATLTERRAQRLLAATVLVVAIAPAFTIGFIVRSGFRSIAMTESNGSPVAFTPIFARASAAPIAWHTSANTNGFETLWMLNSWPASPAACHEPSMSATQMPNSPRGARPSAGM